MRRILLIGRSESGKTTLKQVLRGENITYKKTQYVSQYDCVIDMPGNMRRIWIWRIRLICMLQNPMW